MQPPGGSSAAVLFRPSAGGGGTGGTPHPGATLASGKLYVVATPIGHPDDLGERARRILGAVGTIAAEDTRVARALLLSLGISPGRLVSYHDHNEEQRAPELVRRLLAGEDVALISDAGTPLLSDPGYRLVAGAVEAGVPVIPVPGPSALLAALVAAGLPTSRFSFLGFPPRQAARRARSFQEVRHRTETLIWYEAPHRILATLEALEATLGPRRACLAISLTKNWERFHRGTLPEIRASVAAEGEILGEMTLVVEGHPGDPADADTERALRLVRTLTEAGVGPGVVRDALSATFGWSRREAYQLALDHARDAE